MDLNAFEVKTEGADLALLNPISGEALMDEHSGEPVSIRLVGTDSKECLSESHEVTNVRLRRRLSSRNGAAQISAEEIDENTLRVLAACTKDWRHIIVDGKELTCTRENAIALYRRFRWIRDQVDAFVQERQNFLGN